MIDAPLFQRGDKVRVIKLLDGNGIGERSDPALIGFRGIVQDIRKIHPGRYLYIVNGRSFYERELGSDE